MKCKTMSGGGSVRVAANSFVDGALTMCIVFQSGASLLQRAPRTMRRSVGVKYVIPKYFRCPKIRRINLLLRIAENAKKMGLHDAYEFCAWKLWRIPVRIEINMEKYIP